MKSARVYILTMVVLAVCCSASLAAAREQPNMIEVPFSHEQGQIFLPVRINGLSATHRMLLNTGISRSVFSHALAKSSALSTTYDNPLLSNADRKYTLQALVRVVEIGVLEHANLNVAISAKENVPGILGNDFLKHYVLQIDFPKRLIRFYRKSPFPKDATAAEGIKAVVPMKFTGRDQTLIIEDVQVNGKKMKAMLDTGFAGTLALTPEAVKFLGLGAAGEIKSKYESRKLDSLAVGALQMASPEAFLYGKGSGFDADMATLGGVIGTEFMEKYIVTFDYPHKRVIFS